MFVNYGLYVAALIILQWLSCFPVDPQPYQLSGSPLLRCNGMVPVTDPVEGYREAIHLSWTYGEGRQPVHTYTLLRRFSSDSVFDVFSRSRQIPGDTLNFYDILENRTFPQSGVDSVQYRILAVDTLGRSSDTSEACTFLLAPQPVFTSCDPSSRCCNWESWIRGGCTSWAVVFPAGEGQKWTSPRRDEFPFTDEPARFSACIPDSMNTRSGGQWYIALYLRANEAWSLLLEALDVP